MKLMSEVERVRFEGGVIYAIDQTSKDPEANKKLLNATGAEKLAQMAANPELNGQIHAVLVEKLSSMKRGERLRDAIREQMRE